MTLKALIVDDERLARKELRSLLSPFRSVSVVGEAEDLGEAIRLIESQQPDVVFLDIQLSKENGFDLLDQTTCDFRVIFVTAFDEFAIRAFDINALDYLLKPVNPERLEKAIQRLQKKKAKPKIQLRQLEYDDRLFFEKERRSWFAQVLEISHISASGDYSEVFLRGGRKVLMEIPLAHWESRLPEKHFTRIHRSTIINLNHVERIEPLFNRTMTITLQDHPETLTVSRRYAAILKAKFG